MNIEFSDCPTKIELIEVVKYKCGCIELGYYMQRHNNMVLADIAQYNKLKC